MSDRSVREVLEHLKWIAERGNPDAQAMLRNREVMTLIRIAFAARGLQDHIAEFQSLEYAQEHLEAFDAALDDVRTI